MIFDIKVGFLCNNKCIHCVVGDEAQKTGRNLKLHELKEILVKNRNKFDVLQITGGEATIRSDFLEFIRFAKEDLKISQIVLQTNGRMFFREDFTEASSKFLSKVLIAYHSHNPIIHDMITMVNGSWNQTHNGILNLMKHSIPFNTQTVISKLNCDTLYKTFSFIKENYTPIKMNMTFPHPYGNAWDYFEKVVPKYSSFKEEILSILKDFSDSICTEAIPYCYMYPHLNHENLDDNLKKEFACGVDVENKEGKFFDKDGYTDNYSESMLSEKIKINSCKECLFNSDCVGVWKEYYQKYYNEMDLYPVKK